MSFLVGSKSFVLWSEGLTHIYVLEVNISIYIWVGILFNLRREGLH